MNSQNKKMVMMQKIFNPSQYRLNSGLGTLNRDNYIRVMQESINKAINSDEGPVKEKHVRRMLIASFQFESGQFFWENLTVIRLKENQIVCWKFCHVVHKLIRDGHRQALVSCSERKQLLLDCGNLWRHVQNGYGPLIHAYCELLFNRIKFHNEFPNFPNDLRLSDEQLDTFDSQETTGNLLYELGVEMLESISAILVLSDRVLESFITKRLSSTSNAGRCHLTPIVACVQDSSLFYDVAVKILFKLHARLSAGFMQFLRERFNECHKGMKEFFARVRNLQYFRTLIQIPQLSEKPPNFLIASEFEQHVSPQVIMISDTNERESPDHELLVNLDDDSASSIADDSSSTINAQSQLPDSGASTSLSIAPSGSAIDPFSNDSSSDDLIQVIRAQADNETRALNDRIQALEALLIEVKGELEREKSDHEKTKQGSKKDLDTLQSDMCRLRQELSKMRHQLSAATNANDKLTQECLRAKHDNEISQVAMKKLVKEMSELKARQNDELQQVKLDATKEADSREEDLLMAEMNETDKIIKEATRKIEELSEKSRKIESGIKLQVNEKIAEREIVASDGKGIVRDEFYKRNSSWTEGLISAANVVAMAARSLVDAADRSMSNQAKFSELAAAAHEVASATTQLVVASRVKANKDSEKLKLLTSAAKQVNQCTSNVVEASRVCAELVEQEVEKIDISTLSLHQTKKLEMETQIRLLELEEYLTKERTKLGLLRRQHYEQEEAQASDAIKM